MTRFYTIISIDHLNLADADTDVSPNSHRSVRSYKTLAAARLALKRGCSIPGVEYKILETIIEADGVPTADWTA